MGKHTFGWALEAMTTGFQVFREDWPPGMILELSEEISWTGRGTVEIMIDARAVRRDGDDDGPGIRVPWIPSNYDILKEDWQIKGIQK